MCKIIKKMQVHSRSTRNSTDITDVLIFFLFLVFKCIDPGGIKPTVTAEKGQYTVEVGKDVSLSCLGDRVKRDPFTWIYWEFNATKIDTSTHHYNDSKKYSNPNDGTTPKVHMKLTIFNAHHSDEGNYTCVVFSYQTRYSDGISLQVRAKKGMKKIGTTTYNLSFGLPLTRDFSRPSSPNRQLPRRLIVLGPVAHISASDVANNDSLFSLVKLIILTTRAELLKAWLALTIG